MTLNRDESWRRTAERSSPWDMIIVGGGATGIGVALDAATRGLDVLLVEQSDFGKGTSSRSTKLVHGGVRYLRQGNVSLVRDALRERTLLRKNAPHVVHDLSFLIPCHSWWQRFFYGVGLKVYDLLAWSDSFGRSHGVSKPVAIGLVPPLSTDGLRGGVIYHDGQFDDSRLLINMARTASDHGACLLNYATVTKFEKDDNGRITAVQFVDGESGETVTQSAHCVVNATGPFCDAVRRLDDSKSESMIAASQGVHLVLPRHFFPGDVAMIVPKTSDGRVIFIIPWRDHILVGTTDTPIDDVPLEPSARDDEIEFLLETTAQYLSVNPQRSDVLSVFTGIRPLVSKQSSKKTSSLSRDHVITVSSSDLITITGGKWTTVRKMGEDCVDHAVRVGKLTASDCVTETLPLHGSPAGGETPPDVSDPRGFFGRDLAAITQIEQATPALAAPLHPDLTIRGSDVVWAAREEMARSVEDVLARRSRSLLLNSRASVAIAPKVAGLMAAELGRDAAWEAGQVTQFEAVARHYLPPTE